LERQRRSWVKRYKADHARRRSLSVIDATATALAMNNPTLHAATSSSKKTTYNVAFEAAAMHKMGRPRTVDGAHRLFMENNMTEAKVTRRGMVGGAAALAAIAASHDAVGPASAQTALKTYVLVHGTLVGGWYWRRVSDLLEKNGQKVFSPTLTGLGERSHLLNRNINLDTHITDIVNVIKWEDLNDICLVVHSYGGWVGSGALEQIGDRVSSIVWLDAFKPENGQKPIDFTNEGFRKAFLNSMEKGEPGFPIPPPSCLRSSSMRRTGTMSTRS
jgi:Alpha/beta hydrolase family